MKKPNETILKLYNLGWINEMKIDYKQTGTDTADTFCVLGDGKKQIKGKWDAYKEYLDVRVSHAYIAKLKPEYEKQVEDYVKKAAGPYNWNLLFHQWPTREYESAAQDVLCDRIRNGQLKADEFITHRFSITDIAQAFEEIRTGNTLKVFLTFDW